jgi:hypothetical protein
MGPASYGKPSHTFESVLTDASGTITAITNQNLCNTCHTSGTSPGPVSPAVLESESAGYQQATTILNNWVRNVGLVGGTNYVNYLNLAITSSNATNPNVVPINAYGAFQNGLFYGDEPCAYVHNRFYIKRLIFDSIDWMDNGVLNGTITIDAATFPAAAAWFGANTTTGVATRP